jgi:hypothetical protein
MAATDIPIIVFLSYSNALFPQAYSVHLLADSELRETQLQLANLYPWMIQHLFDYHQLIIGNFAYSNLLENLAGLVDCYDLIDTAYFETAPSIGTAKQSLVKRLGERQPPKIVFHL